jgi:hypothetical protein
LIVVLWRAGLRIQEALALAEADLDLTAALSRFALACSQGASGERWVKLV